MSDVSILIGGESRSNALTCSTTNAAAGAAIGSAGQSASVCCDGNGDRG